MSRSWITWVACTPARRSATVVRSIAICGVAHARRGHGGLADLDARDVAAEAAALDQNRARRRDAHVGRRRRRRDHLVDARVLERHDVQVRLQHRQRGARRFLALNQDDRGGVARRQTEVIGLKRRPQLAQVLDAERLGRDLHRLDLIGEIGGGQRLDTPAAGCCRSPAATESPRANPGWPCATALAFRAAAASRSPSGSRPGIRPCRRPSAGSGGRAPAADCSRDRRGHRMPAGCCCAASCCAPCGTGTD